MPESPGNDGSDGPAGPSPKPPVQPANWGLAFDLGLRLGVSVIIGVGLGALADNWLHTSPIFILVGVVLGVGAAMYTIWEVAREGMR